MNTQLGECFDPFLMDLQVYETHVHCIKNHVDTSYTCCGKLGSERTFPTSCLIFSSSTARSKLASLIPWSLWETTHHYNIHLSLMLQQLDINFTLDIQGKIKDFWGRISKL